MEENRNPMPEPQPEITPQVKPETLLMARGRELIYGGVTLLLGILLCNFAFFGGLHLGFGILAGAAIGWAWLYQKQSGGQFGWYERALLLLSALICLGFGRSDDGRVKFVMLLFLFVAVNLALCIGAGQNRRDPQGAMSLLDAPRAFYRLGVGGLGRSAVGLAVGIRQGGATTRRVGAVGMGLLISVPILAVMILLLMSADAAFEGLMDLLPEFKAEEYFISGIWGAFLAWVLYTRGVSLAKSPKPMGFRRSRRGANALTVNTVLLMVSLLYAVYLLSQLAYFSGGLSGILPEGFTMAEYARRGFFEMAWLCAINLGLLCLSIWLIRGEMLPRLTRIAGTFLAAITCFLILTASAKMFLYIGSYGLTWSRVTTEVFMLWLAITTVLVTVQLFLPKFGYMKAVVLTAMVLGTLVFWVDVDTLVANYNVSAYRSGKLETVDVSHLETLGAAAVPRLLELAEDDDPSVAQQAREILSWENRYTVDDLRHWNYSRGRADRLLTAYQEAQEQAIRAEFWEILEVDVSDGTIRRDQWAGPAWQDGKRLIRIEFEEENRKAFAKQLEEAGWESIPISAKLMALLNRDTVLLQEFRRVYLNNSEKAGFWYFRDLHPDAADPGDPEAVLLREEYDFLIAYYNANDSALFVFQVEKGAEQKAS